jgi:hypothetical protein
MAQVRFLNRNRPNWLWAFSSLLVLLPLMLAQSSAGGCGATVTAPNPDANSDPNGNGTLDETIVDSDGDGFSDDVEINSTPGTDPQDPTDNPNNVRDSDGDGCSDYDELHFANSCDNDPNTPTSSCNTTYYNADFLFGFNLPTNAALTDTSSDDGAIIFSANWLFLYDGVMGVSTHVGDQPPQPLADFVNGLNETHGTSGFLILDSFAFMLADGTPAYFTSLIAPDGDSVYVVDTFANGYVYELWTDFPGGVPTDAAHSYMIAILDSLCVD